LRAALAPLAAHRHAEAWAALEALIRAHGEDAEALLLLATLRLAADPDPAEALLRRAIALAPTNAHTWHYLGKAAEQKGDRAAAIGRLRRAAALDPHFAPTHNDLGAMLQQTGERDAALAALDRAIAIDPDYTTAHHNRGMLLAEMRRPEEARGRSGGRRRCGRQGGRRLDLDYAGMDCTILPDGRVLVFEANAAMLVHLRESREAFAYKHRHVPRIIAAVGDMVLRRIAEHRLSRTA
jgi:tetratricopeptide (TPR) repeat protein